MLNPLIFSNQNRFLQSQFDRKRKNLLGRAPVNTAALFYRPVSANESPARCAAHRIGFLT